MGKLILIEGEPGTGKSRSIKSLDPKKTLVIKPNNKDFPFPGSRKLYNADNKNVFITKNLLEVKSIINKINADESGRYNTIVLEDLTHYFSNRVMKEAKVKGFDKWTDLAVDTFNAFLSIEDVLRDDLYIIVIAHTQVSTDESGVKIINLQTPGKLLENNIKIPSYFTYVLHTVVTVEGNDVKYNFLTNNDGSGKEAKSPEGCLELLEPNDCQLIIDKIEKYQNNI